MASEQLRRENKTGEREVCHVEKDKVPKIASHFESIAVKDTGDDRASKGDDEHKGPSLDEISKYRGTAQQNSMEAILAAEEKYRKSKAAMENSQQTKQGISGSNEKSPQIGQQAKQSLSGAAQMAARASDFTVVKTQQAKEGLSSAAQTAAEKAARAKDYTLETTVDATKRGAGYVGEKAVAAKDIALETGKTTAGYVGKVGGAVKHKAVVAGWSAAEFASDKAVGATETLANATAGVAGFAGNTALATKDVIVDVGKKTKDMVVSAEESAKEYAARKKAEKQRELEAKDEGERVGEEEEEEEETFQDEGMGGRGYDGRR